MAKLRMTYKNLKALRKTKEYQALLVDLVANNIVPKSVAENLLGYNIPANLIGGTEPDNEEQGSGSGTEGSGTEGSGTEGSGTEGSGTKSDNTVTLLYYYGEEWHTEEYDISEDPTGSGIVSFAQEAFEDSEINAADVVEEVEAPDYVDGESDLIDKYNILATQPETLEPGMLVFVHTYSGN